MNLYADDATMYDIVLDKDMLENNLHHSLNLLKIWCFKNGMIINIDKTKLMLISSRKKRKCLKYDKLALVYYDFDLQLTSCEKMLGVHIDNNLTWTNHFDICFKKGIVIPLAVVSDKIIHFFTTQRVILKCLSLTLNIVV